MNASFDRNDRYLSACTSAGGNPIEQFWSRGKEIALSSETKRIIRDRLIEYQHERGGLVDG